MLNLQGLSDFEKDFNKGWTRYEAIRMEELTVKIPEGLPLLPLKKKIDELVWEEVMRWTLFEGCREELSLTEPDLKELERAREAAWRETKKRYGL